jgi:hypothetical protein
VQKGNRKKRYVFTSLERTLPLFIESIGFNPYEEEFYRPEGYPYFHWLHSVKGEGNITFSGLQYLLKPGNGVFLTPFTPHSYTADGKKWTTLYVTFGGAAVDAILDSLNIITSIRIME